MSVAFYVDHQKGQKEDEYFVMKASAEGHHEVAGPFKTAKGAWRKARAASGPDAIYTTLPDGLTPPGDPRRRACWLVK